jgi:ubiquinone/menaquinone biosynthesis C-methylase UbiE
MSKTKESIYDNIYGTQVVEYQKTKSLIDYLYRRLTRYEIDRCQAISKLLSGKQQRLLDLGCGDGYFIFLVRSKFEECYGVDVSSMRIEKAKLTANNLQCESNFSNHDIDTILPFADSFFDVVTCMSVLEHVINPPNVIDEVYRVLKPGGSFLLQVPNFAWLPFRFQFLFGKLPLTGGVYLCADWEHLHNFTVSILRELLNKKGFSVESISCSGIFANYRKWWPSVLASDLIIKASKVQPFSSKV